MADTQVARRYAQAILNIALDEDSISKWRSDLDDIAFLLSKSEAAQVLLSNSISLEKRYVIVDKALGDVSKNARSFTKLLIKKGRTKEAQSINETFNKLADQVEGICHAEITTAVKLKETKLDEIIKRISDSLEMKVETTSKVDEDLVGGIIIRIGDHLIDGSLRTRLRELHSELKGAQ
jgi:F-type H+-transporting ATPase subunit delta